MVGWGSRKDGKNEPHKPADSLSNSYADCMCVCVYVCEIKIEFTRVQSSNML